ncbi:MAG: hypothetical protein V4702_04170 [Patescibacteria group bacterium]
MTEQILFPLIVAQGANHDPNGSLHATLANAGVPDVEADLEQGLTPDILVSRELDDHLESVSAQDLATALVLELRTERARIDTRNRRMEKLAGGLGIIGIGLGIKVGLNLFSIGTVLTTWSVAAYGIRKVEPPHQSKRKVLEDSIMHANGLE